MQTTDLIPGLLRAFKSDIEIFRYMGETEQNKAAAAKLIDQYAETLQLLDLTLSKADARAVLRVAYLNN